jgi:hypothetical protein
MIPNDFNTSDQEPQEENRDEESTPPSSPSSSMDPILSMKESEDPNEIEKANRKKRSKYNLNKSMNKDTTECFGCMYSSKRDPSLKVNVVNNCISIIEREFGRVDDMILAKMVHAYYKDNIFIPCLKAGKPMYMWRTVTIFNHIRKHIINPVIFLVNSVRKMQKMEDILCTMSFKEIGLVDGSKRVVLDKDNYKLFLETNKRTEALLKNRPKEMIFNTDDFKIDPASVGKVINTSKNFEIG